MAKGNLKRIVSLLLCACLVFLSGCSAMFAPKAGLVEIAGLDEHTEFVSAAAFGDDYCVLLASVFVPIIEEGSDDTTAASEPVSPEEETLFESEQEPEEGAPVAEGDAEEMEPDGIYYQTLNLVNLRSGKVRKTLSLKDCPLKDIVGIRLEENGDITLYDDYEKKQLSYSADLKTVGAVQSYTPVEAEKAYEENTLVGDRFSAYNSFSNSYIEYYGKDRVNCFAFPGETDCLYLTEERLSPHCGNGKRILGSMITDGIDDTMTLRVYDFASRLIVGETETPNFGKGTSVYLLNGAIRQEHAFIVLEENRSSEEQAEENTFINHYYLWNYTVDFQAAPFKLERVTEDDFKKKNEEICTFLKREYGIDTHLNEANEETLEEDEVYALELTADAFSLYETLVGIRAFFELLPEGFVKEVYTGMEHIETGGLEIYLGKSIKGYPSAYANRYGEKYMMTFATDSFNSSTMAHEFMHLIDGRLDDFYWEENLDDVWDQYHPESFEYFGYEDAEEDEAWDEKEVEKVEQYFATRYGMSAATEDRADMFSSLFESGAYENEEIQTPYWYESGKVPAKKAVLLCQMIRKAFPCMKKAPVQVWEKSIEKDIKF